jgi:hypothetical protein
VTGDLRVAGGIGCIARVERMLITITLFTALLAAGALGAPAARAHPIIPGPPECDLLDCLNNPAPPNAGEQRYLNLTRIYGGAEAQRLQIGRATCATLAGGTDPGSVVHDIARHLGTTNQNADQVMDEAMADICPGLHLVPSPPATVPSPPATVPSPPATVPSPPATVFVPVPSQPTPLLPGETICNPLGRWDPDCNLAR